MFNLCKKKIKASDKCTFCKRYTETLTHLFWDCEYIQYFWKTLQILLRDNCGLEFHFTVVDIHIIFGNLAYDKLLNLILMYAKKSLYRMKTEDKMPSCIAFQNSITSFYKVDRHILCMNHKYKEFEQKWGKYKELLII